MSKANELGERKIIEIILANLDKMPDMPVPLGDDVSAVSLNNKRLAVLKTDMLVGKTDIPPGMNLWQAARKAVVMNISDLAAKGVKPLALVTSIGLPSESTIANIEEIANGLNAGAREYDAYVIGGDTGEASDLIISCTAFGVARNETIILRNGAKPGDTLAVTGSFGNTGAGLQMLLKNLDTPASLREKLLEAVYLPKAKLIEGLELAKAGAVSASIDSSDGLAMSLYELQKMSNVGFAVKHLPITQEAKEFAEIHKLNADELALYAGEEYELVLTIKPDKWEKAEKTVRRAGGFLKAIGVVIKDREISYCKDGVSTEIEYKGWEHFKTWKIIN